MKEIKIANYSIYSDGLYGDDCVKFPNRYKGVRVNVNTTSVGDKEKLWFSIYTKKESIVKTFRDVIHKLVFNDENTSIACDLDIVVPFNKSVRTIVFKKKEYKELKENIPVFLKEKGCEVEVKETENGLIIDFD